MYNRTNPLTPVIFVIASCIVAYFASQQVQLIPSHQTVGQDITWYFKDYKTYLVILGWCTGATILFGLTAFFLIKFAIQYASENLVLGIVSGVLGVVAAIAGVYFASKIFVMILGLAILAVLFYLIFIQDNKRRR